VLVTENQDRPTIDELYDHTLPSLFIHERNIGGANCQPWVSGQRPRTGLSQSGNQTCRKPARQSKKQRNDRSVEHDILSPYCANKI
jgi:hypothetical protein